jgi:hypothetical protein
VGRAVPAWATVGSNVFVVRFEFGSAK